MDNDDIDDAEPTPAPPISSEFSGGTVDAGLRAMRARLLDLTARNRLLNFRHSPKSTLRFVDAPISAVFERLMDGDRLVIEEVPEPPPVPESRLLFDGTHGPTVKPTAAEFARTLGWATSFDLEGSEGREPGQVRTLHYADALDSICRRIGNAARTAVEESGTNMLYLAFGFLEWFESDDSAEPRLAPLVTVPVDLERAATKNGSPSLELSGDDTAPNLSLIERMKRDFGIDMPMWDEEETLDGFFQRLERAIERKARWRVRRQLTLSLLSFGKLLMFRDLDPQASPQIRTHAIVRELFEGRKSDRLSHAGEYTFDDDRTVAPTPPAVVLDADSSQLSALVDAMQGKNLVIEGPPGTGKSQTISNLIAAALAEGKTVLFVSEKLAALEVVRRRLDQSGIGLFCLELHSHKTRKDALLRDVEARISAHGSFAVPRGVEEHDQNLDRIKARLRQYARLLQHRHEPLDKSLFQLVWRRERLAQEVGQHAPICEGLRLAEASSLQRHDLDRIESNLLVFRRHLEGLLGRWGNVDGHPWAWVRTPVSYDGIVQMGTALHQVTNSLAEVQETSKRLSETYGLDMSDTVGQLSATLARLGALPAPPTDGRYDLFSGCRSQDARTALLALVGEVQKWRDCRDVIVGSTTDGGQALLRDGVAETVHAALVTVSKTGRELLRVDDVEAYLNELVATHTALTKALSAYTRLALLLGWSEPCGLLSGRAVAACLGLVAAAPTTELHLRTPLFEAPGIPAVIDEARKESGAISARWANLAADYDMGLAVSVGATVVRSHAQTVALAGLWQRWFGRAYREAKGFCRLISTKDPGRRATETARALLDVAAVVEARDRFASHPRYKAALQHLFAGLETDWEALDRVSQWYIKVRDEQLTLDGPFGDALKSLLLESSADRIVRLTKQLVDLAPERSDLGALPDVFQKLEAEGLCERGSGAADTAVRVADRVKETSEALGILRALQLKSEATLAAVPDLLRTADEYLVLTESLAAAEKVKVIGPPSAWGRTDLDAIVAAVDFAERIVEGEWPAPLLEAVLSSSCLDALADLRIRTDRGHAEVTQLLGSASVIERLSGDASWTEPNTSLDHLSSRAAASVGAADELAPWSQWLSVRAAITGDGLESLIALFERQQIPASDLLPAFQLAHHSNIVRSLLWESRDSLLSGLDQEEMRKQFRLADREGIRLARVRTAARIAKRQVPAGQQTGPVKTWTELALIVNEISKQRRHIPIRQLVLRAGRALQALKPCFLMGPLSVAQYLPPGGLTFDMVVMDEASQLKPEDAIGAVARGGQLVVVGDPKQLPPTNFFQRVLHDEEDDDEELTVASEGESILDVASALYQPIRRLRWHYRSRHESLIAFSNREFYDGKLFICPSAYDKHLDLGVRYRHVRGVYENRKNALEAAAVADAVADHVRSTSGLSLGVVALNYEQADLLEEVIDRRLADEPEAPAYRELMEERDEPLFVKNLENVQGDERDVIFVSCTYGPDAVGNQYQRFGPVNSADGHRRLNVLFTRAKRRCEVFSSLNPDKINDDGKQRGVRVFKQYLKYAQTGRLESIVDSGQRAAESDFEESVGTLLRQEGYDIRTQIGVSGFWIDIGVRNPAKPGTYVLGIECDGRAYHSGRSARDRDRLRQEILENQGWKIHRIWSTDWFHSRKTAVERLLTRVNQALESDSDYREYRARQQRRDSARALLTTLAEEISREHPGTPPERRLLRGEMFDLFIAKRPVSQPDWFRIPLQLREQTDSTEIRLYLSRVLAIFRDTSE